MNCLKSLVHHHPLCFIPFAGTRQPQLVLLDHGLYRTLDPTIKSNYAALWKVRVLLFLGVCLNLILHVIVDRRCLSVICQDYIWVTEGWLLSGSKSITGEFWKKRGFWVQPLLRVAWVLQTEWLSIVFLRNCGVEPGTGVCRCQGDKGALCCVGGWGWPLWPVCWSFDNASLE